MCSSMLLVVQSTIVVASRVRGSAPRPTTISLPRPCASAATAHSRDRPSERASSACTRHIRSPFSRFTSTVRSVQLVQREPEARDERLQEVADLRKVETLDVRAQGFLGLGELGVAGAGLLEALEVGAELVGRPHQLAVRAVARLGSEEGLVARLQRGGAQRKELLFRRGLDRAIRALDLGIELLHGRAKIAAHDLARVAIERQRGGAS